MRVWPHGSYAAGWRELLFRVSIYVSYVIKGGCTELFNLGMKAMSSLPRQPRKVKGSIKGYAVIEKSVVYDIPLCSVLHTGLSSRPRGYPAKMLAGLVGS